MRVGASVSILCRSDQSSGDFSASPSCALVERGEPGLAGQRGLEPLVQRGQQAPPRTGPATPASSGSHARRQRTRARHCVQRFAPRQRGEAELRAPRRPARRRSATASGSRQRPGLEHDAVEAPLAHGRDRARVRIPDHPVLAGETLREFALQPRLVERRGAQHQRVAAVAGACAAAQLVDDQPRLAVQRAVVEQLRAAAVGELVAARVARMLARDAVGERVQQHVAERVRGHARRRRGVDAQAPAPLPRGLVDRGQRRARGVGGDAALAERGQRLPALGQRIGTR